MIPISALKNIEKDHLLHKDRGWVTKLHVNVGSVRVSRKPYVEYGLSAAQKRRRKQEKTIPKLGSNLHVSLSQTKTLQQLILFHVAYV